VEWLRGKPPPEARNFSQTEAEWKTHEQLAYLPVHLPSSLMLRCVNGGFGFTRKSATEGDTDMNLARSLRETSSVLVFWELSAHNVSQKVPKEVRTADCTHD